MSTLLYLLAAAALAGMCFALWKPARFYPFKEPTWIKAVGLYFFLAVACFSLASSLAPDRGQESALDNGVSEERARPAPHGPLLWREVRRQKMAVPGSGRERLVVTIVPEEDQTRAGQKELLATATGVAVKTQKESGEPVVVVNFLCQEAENAHGELLLAHVVYIPDGKGFDGASSDSGPWETRRAAQRGFTKSELEYLRLWSERYTDYQSATGLREKELDASISQDMGIAPGSLAPFANILKPIE